jgi:hypothetical protein
MNSKNSKTPLAVEYKATILFDKNYGKILSLKFLACSNKG